MKYRAGVAAHRCCPDGVDVLAAAHVRQAEGTPFVMIGNRPDRAAGGEPLPDGVVAGPAGRPARGSPPGRRGAGTRRRRESVLSGVDMDVAAGPAVAVSSHPTDASSRSGGAGATPSARSPASRTAPQVTRSPRRSTCTFPLGTRTVHFARIKCGLGVTTTVKCRTRSYAADTKVQVTGGALGRIRTCNLLIRSQVLYPLSYERSRVGPGGGSSWRRLRDLNPGGG